MQYEVYLDLILIRHNHLIKHFDENKKSPKNNDWTETNEILYAYTKEDGPLFQLFFGCYDNNKGRQLRLLLMKEFFSLAKHIYINDMHKRKKSTKTQTETLETVIRLQHIFIRALTSSKALKTSCTVLTNVTVSPYEYWCQHCSLTVSSHFFIKKGEIFTK